MNIEVLSIEDALKVKLSSMLNEFESYRIANGDLSVKMKKVEDTISVTEKVEVKKKRDKALNMLLSKFFFSEFDMAS
ncbi:hypothetical protein [Tenacibaculum sp. IB213877]|uniref:hypothetical protein n=1 Tax=Tenacibaculum sp. IB213877 TaxID=3097351 RepID=UPI002A5AD119|nr:hypothetical protein [Tenacibaculum sp. IB213877]MDY0781529.1 hypothetical protein [Tenacibaculum sp. IB213877]